MHSNIGNLTVLLAGMARTKASIQAHRRRIRQVIPDSDDENYIENSRHEVKLDDEAQQLNMHEASDSPLSTLDSSDFASTLSGLSRSPSVSSDFLSSVNLQQPSARPKGIARYTRPRVPSPARPYVPGTSTYKVHFAFRRLTTSPDFTCTWLESKGGPKLPPTVTYSYRTWPEPVFHLSIVNEKPFSLKLPRSALVDDYTERFIMRHLTDPNVACVIPALQSVPVDGIFFNIVEKGSDEVEATAYERGEMPMSQRVLDIFGSKTLKARTLIIVLRPFEEDSRLIGEISRAEMQGGHFQNVIFEPLGPISSSEYERVGQSESDEQPSTEGHKTPLRRAHLAEMLSHAPLLDSTDKELEDEGQVSYNEEKDDHGYWSGAGSEDLDTDGYLADEDMEPDATAAHYGYEYPDDQYMSEEGEDEIVHESIENEPDNENKEDDHSEQERITKASRYCAMHLYM